MRYVQFDTNGGCWLWDSGVTFNGYMHYPIFTLRPGKQQRVGRFMYEHHHGPIPPGLIVRHTCDIPLCVNPAHLVLGTYVDNAQDRERRGRSRWEGYVRKTPALSRRGTVEEQRANAAARTRAYRQRKREARQRHDPA